MSNPRWRLHTWILEITEVSLTKEYGKVVIPAKAGIQKAAQTRGFPLSRE